MQTLTVAGRERTCLLDLPQKPRGLVLVCHGFVCYCLARQPRPRVAAIAPVCGCMMVGWDTHLTEKNRVSVLAVNGTVDKTTLWAGDLANRWPTDLGTPKRSLAEEILTFFESLR